MRIITKGGVWKNSEDEILKAAVMKYGPTQWDRVASLLNRKSAKQCKERWKNWLDPSVKKTEWGRDEEEKLLHLAKIMPNQWHTIAPIVGRTPAQCLEHYDKLLERVQRGDEDSEHWNDPKRLRQGEIDPNPETKPAKPDAIDMDEDEKEMLSEARARLANTKGKKAKRKAREKQLEEARRLTTLQKRREMRAAGIDIPQKKKKNKGIDVNAEIPFHRKAPSGPYEQETSQKPDLKNFKTINLKDIEGKSRKEKEQERKEIATEKEKQKAKKNLPQVISEINKLNQSQEAINKRPKLSLSEPLVSESEIYSISKLGKSNENEDEDEDVQKNKSTQILLPPTQNFGTTPILRTPMRTPKGSRDEEIMRQAENLHALKNAKTPLLGGENPSLYPSDFSSSTPKPNMVQTPNILATPLRNDKNGIGNNRSLGLTPQRTPLRDELKLNPEKMDIPDKKRIISIKDQLKLALASLPAPQNEIVTALPEDYDQFDEEESDNMVVEDKTEEDASDRIKNQELEKKRKLEEKLARRTQVLKRNLPRPTVIPSLYSSNHPDPYMRQAEDLLNEEMTKLIEYESSIFPFPSCRITSSMRESDLTFPKPDQSSTANDILEKEIQVIQKEKKVNENIIRELQEKASKDRFFNSKTKKIESLSKTSKQNQIQHFENEFQSLLKIMEEQIKVATKLEKKIGTYQNGFKMRLNTLTKSFETLNDDLEELNLEYEAYDELNQIESKAIPKRIKKLSQEVETLLEVNNNYQEKYKELISQN